MRELSLYQFMLEFVLNNHMLKLMAIVPHPQNYMLFISYSGNSIRQDIAVTGSVNQMGIVQPVGGINEKIEGFYNACKRLGLSGRQGVIIPIQNVKNLILS